jgi:aminoglycoside phosphotransferase (APT) family kinase protein
VCQSRDPIDAHPEVCVPTSATRDLAATHQAIDTWLVAHLHARGLDARDLETEIRLHTAGGYSNEVIFVTATYRTDDGPVEDRLVVRLPPIGPALFPTYDLAMQVAVQRAVAAHGVPVPEPIIHERDPSWLGAPFLVMPRIDGHDPGELPVANEWIAASSTAQQRALHVGFLDVLARIHTTPWRGHEVATVLRGSTGSLVDELDHWDDLLSWSFDGAPPEALAAAFAWCREHLPASEPPASVLWGDVRLGNMIIGDDVAPLAVLDWEMASIGPAELDLAWYTALEGMTEHFFGDRVPGFLDRDEIAARHERALGRALVDLRWFEVFAMARSTTLNIRADLLEARRRGKQPRPAADNAVLAYTTAAIADADRER